MSEADKELTALLRDWADGDPAAAEALFDRVYQQLRQLARSQLARERSAHTLQPTALVHEAYLKLLRGSPVVCGLSDRCAERLKDSQSAKASLSSGR